MKIINIDDKYITETINKWQKTSILDNLDEDKTQKVALLLENEANYLACEEKAQKNKFDYEENIKKATPLAFAVIRRIFGSNRLTYNFDVCTTPTFLYEHNGETNAKCVQTSKLCTRYNTKMLEDLKIYNQLDAEIEIIAEKLINELNKKFSNDNIACVVHYVPIIAMGYISGDSNNIGLATRYAILSN
tara:strand:- start:869 stop:1435 length:567 start_codon:yes stop_codon:yes gene_type:complete